MKISHLLNLTNEQLAKVTILEITEDKLNKTHIESLISLLPKLPSLEIIACRGNLRGKLFTKLVAELPKCPSLSYLLFPNNKLTNAELKGFIDVLPKFNHLVAVELTNNKFKQLSATDLERLLTNIQCCGSLITFDVAKSKFGDEKNCARINEALAANREEAEKLIDAVRQGNIKKVGHLINKGANINCRIVPSKSKDGVLLSPLHAAINAADFTMVNFLVKNGAKLLPDGCGSNILTQAQKTKEYWSKTPGKQTYCARLGEIITYLSKFDEKKEEKKGELLNNRPLQSSASEAGFFGLQKRHQIKQHAQTEKEQLPMSQSSSALQF
ncbi:ankyrin repeat domain-containing protein [Legionella clemsonensis]|uniref:Ankyrin repeats (3 copies) n=1 Tax=Legionella clemsonensis TaxID=1867846 RepID=A0A222P6E1_9GAMM|nr:ankyrin repeat domain-containing protein [Legionella clemsonensis]ASQ47416.1 Ankyrin repeats (3 copies) [Legionella clemsonensis]